MLAAQAANDVGIDALLADVRKHRAALEQAGALEKRRQARRRAELEALLVEEFSAQITARVQTDPALARTLDAVTTGALDSYSAVARDPRPDPQAVLTPLESPLHYAVHEAPLMLPSHTWYGVVPGWLIFYAMIAVAGALFTRRAWFLLRLLLKGKAMPRWDHVPARVGRVIVYVFAQARLLANDFWPGLMHAIIFWGFVVLTLGTVEFFGRGVTESFFLPLLSETPHYLILQDLFSSLVILAVGYALFRRLVTKPKRLNFSTEALVILLLILGLMVTDLVADAAHMRLVPEGAQPLAVRGERHRRRPSAGSRRPRCRWSSTWPGGRTRACSWASWCCCPTPSTCTSWSRRSTSSSRRSSRRASTAAWISRTRRPSGSAA